MSTGLLSGAIGSRSSTLHMNPPPAMSTAWGSTNVSAGTTIGGSMSSTIASTATAAGSSANTSRLPSEEEKKVVLKAGT
jgi:hypothetical protein